jgi:protein ImuA
MLAELRKTLTRLERPLGLEAAGLVPFGISPIDAALGGGLSRGALHEIAAASEAHVSAATGFALACARGTENNQKSNQKTNIVWIAETMTRIESGAPFGCGLDEFGVGPERLLLVTVPSRRDLLWAMEESLHCQAVGAVIGELRQESIDAVALRRLSLAAAESGALALLLRSTPSRESSTAATRWIVSAAPSQPRYGPGFACFDAQLVRNRRGASGAWLLEWIDGDECFVLASTHPQSVAAAAFDRPAGTVAAA